MKLSKLGKASLANAAILMTLWLLQRFVAEHTRATTLLTYAPQLPWLLPTFGLLLGAAWRWRKSRNVRLFAFNGAVLIASAIFLAGYNIAPRGLISHNAVSHNVMSRAEASTSTSNGATSNGATSNGATSSTRSTPRVSLRVMTFNIRYGADGIEEIAGIIRSQKPDVVCLQETLGYTDYPDPIPLLQTRLRDYPFMARTTEVATFSRLPIVSQFSHSMPFPSSRAMLQTDVDVRGQIFTVYNAHIGMEPADDADKAFLQSQPRALQLGGSTRTRQKQVRLILETVRKTTTPFVVCGDFNIPPRGLIYRALSSELTDSFKVAGWGFGHSFHTSAPLLRIDYIWTAPQLRVLNARVLKVRASDHRPYIVDLSF